MKAGPKILGVIVALFAGNPGFAEGSSFAEDSSFGQESVRRFVDLDKGSVSVFGALAPHYELEIFNKFVHEVKIKSDVGVGYLVRSNLMMGASLPLAWSLYPNLAGRFGLKLFSTYFFNTKSALFPYLGLQATPGYHLGQGAFKLSAGLDVGLLVSLSEHVALDLGLRPEADIKLSTLDNWKVAVPAGFFGVRAFF